MSDVYVDGLRFGKSHAVAQAINQHYGGHVADGSSIQSHSAGLLYPYVIQMQEMTSGDFSGMWRASILPDEPGGAWYSMLHGSAYDAAQDHILTVLKAPKG